MTTAAPPTTRPEQAPAEPVSAAPAATSTGPTLRSTVRRYRGPLLVLLALVLAGVGLAVVTATGPDGELDPDAYTPAGARALAGLLREQGVDVERAGTLEELRRVAGPEATVVVPFPERLTDPELAAIGRRSGRLVVVGAQDLTLEAIGLPAEVGEPVPVEVRQPACSLPAARRAGDALLGGLTYAASNDQDAVGCYAASGRATLLVLPDEGAVLLGSAAFLSNAELGDRGNAALALGLLAEPGEEVVFVLPTAGRPLPEGSAPPLSALVPDALVFAAVQAFVALAVLALWRARRLGRVVEEPLPVVVRAAEAVEGRSRLYRAAGARGQAAEQLRAGTRDRVVRRSGLGPDTPRAAVVGAITERTGRAATEVDDLLYGAAPADDPALVRLADALRSLERSLTSTESRR